MPAPIPGLHHITALSGAAQDTLDFYAGVLGLRRVKTTVNFDDPKTHHLYYGDTVGRPGTVLTFFPWPRARQGRTGAGMVQSVAFAIPADALDPWNAHLNEAGISVRRTELFGDPVLRFDDPFGLTLELVATDTMTNSGAWGDGPISSEHALRGFHAPVLPIFSDDRTPDLFTDLFGWTQVQESENRRRFQAPDSDLANVVDLQVQERHPSGRMGQGTVHHIAFRARDADEQKEWQTALRDRGLQVTDVKDRQYFQSIYFRDPNWTSGILFEIATDGPGFLDDEAEAELGETLRIPSWLEADRSEIEDALPALTSPTA
ncbi:glyoxalase [Salinibacter sp. 10B]|uniref:ring-cleaving dioxygenase n=1 Tax=Salinibacter sp. 10B TaxID=1923971 RepID=UPI000CF3C86F|nr:ring-cleaving dioxygenase [Salinibacter sp. 10B]PQJ34924.1 glyoxalase [Salinibacter sp. 10B]